MNLASIRENVASSGIEMSPDPLVLRQFKTGCPAVIWQRTPLAEFQNWIDAVPVEQLPKLRTILRRGRASRGIRGRGLPVRRTSHADR